MTALAQQLASVHLRHPEIALGEPPIPNEQIEACLAAAGTGLDHIRGEDVVALGIESPSQVAEPRAFFVLTDRQMVGRSGDRFFRVPLWEISGSIPTATGLRLSTYRLGSQEIPLPRFVRNLSDFAHGIASVSPNARIPADQPLVMPTPSDPTGAATAVRNLRHGDPAAAALLTAISSLSVRGQLETNIGVDLASRIVLYNRSARGFRAMREGWWVGPVAAADCAFALGWLFGPPTEVHSDGPRTTYDFSLSGETESDRTVAATSMSPLVARLLAIGWVSQPGESIQRLRVTLADSPSSSCLTLSALFPERVVPIHEIVPSLLRSIHSALRRIEIHLLLRRCALGWKLPADELMQEPEQTLSRWLESAGSRPDLSPFG